MARAASTRGPPAVAAGQAVADVLADGEVREQRPVLEHHADPAPLGWHVRRRPRHDRVADADLAGRRARSRPAIERSSVVLPQPLGPSSATIAPGATARSTSRRTARSPNRLRAPRTAIAAVGASGAGRVSGSALGRRPDAGSVTCMMPVTVTRQPVRGTPSPTAKLVRRRTGDGRQVYCLTTIPGSVDVPGRRSIRRSSWALSRDDDRRRAHEDGARPRATA